MPHSSDQGSAQPLQRLFGPYPSAAITQPIDTFFLAMGIALVALLWALALPALVAGLGDVFYEEGLQAKLNPDVKAALARQEPQIILLPFYRNPQMWLRPVEWTCLGWLLFLARPPIPCVLPR